MKYLPLFSFLEYQNEQNPYDFTQKLCELGISKNKFFQVTFEMAKSVQHLSSKNCKGSTNLCIITVEKFLRGEATAEECRHAANLSAKASSDTITDGFIEVFSERAAASAARAAASIYYDASCSSIAYNTAYVARTTSRALGNVSTISSYAVDILRGYFPWNLVCGYQVAWALNREKDEDFVLQVSKNQKMVSYATMILSEPSMHKNFKFFMKEYNSNV